MPNLSLSYTNPVTAVFLRTLAWELYVAGKHLTVQDVVSGEVQSARKELGLKLLEGGAAHDFIQKLRLGPKPLLSPKNTPPKPLEQIWPHAWRLLYLPPHSLVRQLSEKPVYTNVSPILGTPSHFEFLVTLRNPALPKMHVFVGAELPSSNTFGKHRGLYFLRLTDSLYVGKTDEFDVRLFQHQGKTPLWWVFVSPEQGSQTFTKDALDAAEALLISFWNEVSILDNKTRGGDQEPEFTYLQQAVLMIEAVSGVLLWLMRDKQSLGLPSWTIPFKQWRGNGWPGCYLEIPNQI